MLKLFTENNLSDLKSLLDTRYRDIPHLYYDMDCNGILEPQSVLTGSSWVWEDAAQIISSNRSFFLHIIDTSAIAARHSSETMWGADESGFKQEPRSYKRACFRDRMHEGQIALATYNLNIYLVDVCNGNIDNPISAGSISNIRLNLTCPIDSIEVDTDGYYSTSYAILSTGMCFLCIPSKESNSLQVYEGTLVNGGISQVVNVDGEGGSCNCPTFSSSDAGKLIAVGINGELEGVTVSNYLSKY